MSGSRGFFYDNCHSWDKFTREWTARIPASWLGVTVFDNTLCYTEIATASGQGAVLQSAGRISNCEVQLLFGSSDATFIYQQIQLRRRTNDPSIESPIGCCAIFINDGSLMHYLVDSTGTSQVIGTMVHGVTWDATKLYWLKSRIIGRKLQTKFWLRGLAEPNWMLTSNMTYQNSVADANGWFSIRPVGTASPGNMRYFSDIRITPIRKVGGL